MIRPKIHAVEGERATRKRNTRQIFHDWLFLPRIETRDTPILVRLFHAAQDVDHFIDKGVAANFRATSMTRIVFPLASSLRMRCLYH